jgi:hypothetical protein
MSASSVALLLCPRINDITWERFDFVKTSAIWIRAILEYAFMIAGKPHGVRRKVIFKVRQVQSGALFHPAF